MTESLNETLSILVIEDDPGDFGLVKAYLGLAGLIASGAVSGLVWAKTLAQGIAAAQIKIPAASCGVFRIQNNPICLFECSCSYSLP